MPKGVATMPDTTPAPPATDEIATHLATLRTLGRSHRTITCREAILKRFADYLAPRPLFDATEDDVILWLDNPEWAKSTRRTYHANLAAFYGWAERRDKIRRSPLAGLTKPATPKRPPRTVSDEHLARALEGAQPRTRIWMILARYNGLRAAEIAALQPEDIDWNLGTLTIHGKGDKDAVLTMHPIVREKLREWVDGNDGHTWTTRPDCVSHAGNYALRRVGCPAKFHGLRHGFAMHLYDRTGDAALVSRALRHASLATTQIYVQTRDAALSAAILDMGETA